MKVKDGGRLFTTYFVNHVNIFYTFKKKFNTLLEEKVLFAECRSLICDMRLHAIHNNYIKLNGSKCDKSCHFKMFSFFPSIIYFNMEKVSFPILVFLLLQKMLLKYFNFTKILFAVCVCTICLLLKQIPQILEDKYIGTETINQIFGFLNQHKSFKK